MNNHKICFIICYNDDLFLSECCLYIQNLEIPAGYEIDIISVGEAGSMTEGYQAAMLQSDARYKVYLHQDVFIINKRFLFDILDVFRRDSQIGMIGMVGSVRLPDSGVMWEGERCGAIYSNKIIRELKSFFEFNIPQGGYLEVEAVDGLLMATCVDIPWREDLFHGWDFYDISQCMEFQKAGYKVVVPYQMEPWCLHDDDIFTLTEYKHWQRVFLQHYRRQE